MPLAKSGARFLRSMRIALTVLMRVSPSAPPSTTACAMATISVTFGVSLTNSGLRMTAFTAETTSFAVSGCTPNSIPPLCTLGQLMFNSIAQICGWIASFCATSTYSSREKPATFAIMPLRETAASLGSSSAMTLSTPGFCKPTALSIPEALSAMRGRGLPNRASRVVPFRAMVPKKSGSRTSARS